MLGKQSSDAHFHPKKKSESIQTSSKRIRLCGHIITFSNNKSNISDLIFTNSTYYGRIISFLSFIDILKLRNLSKFHNSWFCEKKHQKYFKILLVTILAQKYLI